MTFDFPTLSKVSATLQVLLYLDSEVLLVYRLFALLLTILNLRHPYIVVATATTDIHQTEPKMRIHQKTGENSLTCGCL